MATKILPIIVFPTDETRQQQLRNKLVEYRGRIHPYLAPERQMDTICKIVILERLLHDGRVNTGELSREMAKTHESSFDVNLFNNACHVIEDYCKTGGQNVYSGMGKKRVCKNLQNALSNMFFTIKKSVKKGNR